MGFKKNKGKAGKPTQVPVGVAVPKKHKESILVESVFETAVNEFRKNKLFVVRRDDTDLFVGLYMPFERIGGLSVKDKSDESKGSIINLINSGRMSVLHTPILADEEAVVFIPNLETVTAMNDYVCLADQTVYDIVFVDPSNELIEKTQVKVNLAQIQRLLDTSKPVSTLPAVAELLVDVELDDGRGSNSLVTTQTDVITESFRHDDEDDEEELHESDDDEEIPGEDGYPEDEPSEDEPEPSNGSNGSQDDDDEDEVITGSSSGFDDEADTDIPAVSEQEPEPQGDVDVSHELTVIASARRFFNDDLTRSLDTAGLDQALAPMTVFRPLEKRPGGWLDDQINAMTELANNELFRVHQNNIMTTRQHYLDIMVAAYETEMRGVLELDSDTRYARLQELKAAQSQRMPHEIEEERKQLISDWENRIHEAGEAARQSAENSYRERYRWQHEEKVRAVEMDMKTGMEAAFERSVSELKAIRKKEAETKLDALDTQTIDAAIAEYEKLAQSEIELFEQHKAQIMAFLDENRQAEIARINVLAEEHVRTNKIQVVEAEYSARVASLQEEFDARVSALNQDIAQMRARHADDIAAKELAEVQLSNKHQAESELQQKRIDTLIHELTNMDDVKKREIAGQIDNLTADKDSYANKYDMLVRTQRRGNRLMAALCLVAVIAAMALGVWGGIYLAKQVDVPAWTTSQSVESQRPDSTPGLVGE